MDYISKLNERLKASTNSKNEIASSDESDFMKKLRKRVAQSEDSFSNIDSNYIKSFFDDAETYLTNSQTDSEGINYNNASSLYTTKKATWSALRDKADNIRAYYNAHKGDIDEETYNGVISSLDAFDSMSKESLRYYKSNADFASQFSDEIEYNTNRMSLDELEQNKNTHGENTVAYTTKDGRDVRWGELYNQKFLAHDLDTRYKEYSAMPDWSEKSTAIKHSDDTISDHSIVYGLSQSTIPYDKNTALSAGYTEEEYEAEAKKRQYIMDKYNVDLYSDIYNNVNIYGNLLNQLQKQKGETETFDFMNALTNEEKTVLSYIYNTEGRAAALDWHNSRRDIYRSRNDETLAGVMAHYANEHPVISSILSVPATLLSGAEAVSDFIDYAATGHKQTNTLAQISQVQRATVSDKVDWEIGNWDAFDFLYNTGMSGLDSLAASTLPAGAVLLGLSAGSQAVNNALERGLSADKAFWNGLASGVFEMFFEKISIGNLKNLKAGFIKGGKSFAKEMAKTMLVNASEETLTEIANITYDLIANGDFSNYANAVRTYMKNGLSESDAKLRASVDLGAQVVESGASGALMGFGFGATGSASAHNAYNQYAAEHGQQVINQGGADTLKQLAQEMYAGKSGYDAKRGAKLLGKANQDASAKNIGKLSDHIGDNVSAQNQAEMRMALEKRGISKGEAKKLATAFDAIAQRKGLTEEDVAWVFGKMSKNEHIADVFQDFVQSYDAGVTQRSLELFKARNGVAKNASEVTAETATEESKVAETPDATNVTEDEGKTILKDSGTEVTIEDIVSIEDGKMMLKVNDGTEVKEVDSSNISYASNEEAALYESVARLNVDAESAKAIIGNFDAKGDLSVGQYIYGAYEAYTYGKYNFPVKEMSKNGFSAYLNEAQKTIAYNRGRIAYMNSVNAQDSAVKKAAEGAQKGNKGNVRFVDSDSEKTLTPRQKASKEALDTIAKALGVDIYLYESKLDDKNRRTYIDKDGKVITANGYYDPKTGDIYIDINAGQNGEGVMLFTAAHELTHFIRQWSPAKFNALANFLMAEYGKEGVPVAELVRAQFAKGKQYKEDFTYDDAYEEMIADSLQTMLSDGAVVEKLAKLAKQDKTLVDKMLEYINGLVNRIKKAYAKMTPYSKEGRYGAMLDEAERLQELFYDALVSAGENYRGAGGKMDVANAEMKLMARELGNDLGTIERNDNGDIALITNKDKSLVLYSARTYEEGGREKLEATLKANGHTQEEINDTLKLVDDAADYLRILAAGYAKQNYGKFGERLSEHLEATVTTDLKGHKQVLSTLVNNGDYPVNLDLALICKKRVAYMRLMNRLIEDGVFGDVVYGGDAIAEVNAILRENGFETACLGCFVESRRLQFQTWAETIVQEWNEAVDAHTKNAGYFGFAKGGKGNLTEADMDAMEAELEGQKKNDKGNVNLGQGSAVTRMNRLLDKMPSLAKKLTVDDLLTPQGLTTLRQADGNLFSIVKSRYGAASPKIVQEFSPYASEIAKLTFSHVKKMTGESVSGAQKYQNAAKKELAAEKPVKQKGESNEDFKAREQAWKDKAETLAMNKYLFDIGGARIQSFSDFMIENVFDYIQIMADLAAKGSPLHGYTKEIACLRLFGMTGAKWNGSLIAHVDRSMGKEYAGLLPASEAKNGNAILVNTPEGEFAIGFDDYARHVATNKKTFIQSIGMKDIVALMLDPRYSANVGNITIGVSDMQILGMLDSPLFRMVIPYHASGMLPQFAQLVGVDFYNDYTNYQNTTVKQYFDLDKKPIISYDDKGNKVSEIKNSKGDTLKPDMSYKYNEKVQALAKKGVKDAPRQAANDYIAWCGEMHEVFDGETLVGYATLNPKFSDSPTHVDFSKHKNYYKLLEDFNMYDNNTEAVALQGAVKMVLPSEANRLSAEQMDAYKQALRDTGIFSEADITKYAKKADMTFEEIIKAEMDNRQAYEEETDPKWDTTVKKIEDHLKKHHPRDGQAKSAEDYKEAKGDKAISRIKAVDGSYAIQLADNEIKQSARDSDDNTNPTSDPDIRYSERDFPIDADVEKTVNNAFAKKTDSMNVLSDITSEQNKAINRLVLRENNDAYRGKYEGGKHRFSDNAIRHIISEHGDFLRAGLRAQLPMTRTDIARHLSAIKDDKMPSSIKPSKTREGLPSILTSYEVNGYTLYAEEIKKPLGENLPSDLIGHTMYKAPTLPTAAFYTTSVQPQPKRQSIVLCEYSIPNNPKLSTGNFVSDKNGDPALLNYISLNGNVKQDVRISSLIALSSDSANFTDKSGKVEQGYVRCEKPFYITHNNRVFDNSKTNVSAKIEELKKQGYDCFIFDKTVGDNYMVAVINKAQIIKDKPTMLYSERDNGNEKILRSERDPDAVSNRSLLANALEDAVQNDIEKKKLQQYKEKIDFINAEERKLADLNRQLRELRFSKGKRDTVKTKQINDLQAEATKTANRISVYDKQLLSLEASKPLKNILEREKAKAAKRQKQRDAEILQEQRDKANATIREIMNRNTESRKRAVEGRHKTVVRNKIKRAINDLNQVFNKGTKERNVKIGLRDTVRKALAASEVLFSDEITNEDIVRLGVDSVSAEEQEKLERYLELLIGIENAKKKSAELAQSEHFKKDSIFAKDIAYKIQENNRHIVSMKNQVSKLNRELEGVFIRERARLNKENVSTALDSLAEAYASLQNSDDDYIKNNAFVQGMHDRIKSLSENLNGVTIKDMSLEQLEEVYKMYSSVKHMIVNANSIFRDGLREDLSKKIMTVQGEILALQKDNRKDPRVIVDAINNAIKSFDWNNQKPVYAFEKLGSQAFQELFWDAIKAEGVYAQDIVEAGDFLDAQKDKFKYADWDFRKATTFKSANGLDFKLTLADMMSIYAYSKRPQAFDHMTQGGFTFDRGSVYVDEKGRKRKHVRLSETYTVSIELINEIVKTLSEEQIGYVDAVQAYLTSLGEKGNEISRVLYGIDLFTEQVYFPLKSDADYRSSVEQALNETQTQVSLKNTGMTKQTVPHANNPIVLQGFDDVVLGHIDNMSKYHSFVLPIENLRRVFDNVSRDENASYDATKVIIESVFGESAKQYFDQYITDLNGGVHIGGYRNFMMDMFSKMKKTAVSASLSVVVQQPFAITRAMDMINPVYFAPVNINAAKKNTDAKSQWEELKRYAPVAIIKEMGGFDVGSSRTTRDYIGGTNYSGFGGRLKGFFKDSDYRNASLDNIFMWGASKADELGWSTIWKAVKKEVASQHKELAVGSEEFLKKCGERFTEIIVYTQVYDSVNSRSGMMRSKRDLDKFATSFMGEPTTTINMVENSMLKLARAVKTKDGKTISKASAKMGRTIGVTLGSILLTSLAKSLIYAGRDDDEEDKALLERWAKSFGDSLTNDLNPLTMIPYLRDFVSIWDGWDVERPDMTVVADIVTSIKKAIDEGCTVEEALALIGNAGNALGLPVKNLIREVQGAINVFGDITDDIKPTDIGGAFAEGWSGEEQSNKKALYNAITNGNKAKIEAIRAEYKTEEAYESALKQAIRENHTPLKQTAIDIFNGNFTKKESAVSSIARELDLDEDFVSKAIDAEYSYFTNKLKEAAEALAAGEKKDHDDIVKKLRERYRGIFSQDEIVKAIKEVDLEADKDTDDEEKASSVYKTWMINEAFENGDTNTALAIIEDLVATKVANGKTEKDAIAEVKKEITSYWKPLFLEANKKSNEAEKKRTREILYATGLYGNGIEVNDTTQQWIKDSKKKK